MSQQPMRLLFAVIDPTKLDEVLSGFLDLGISGATVVHSEGMGRILSDEIPVFAGLQTLSPGRPQNRLVLSVVAADRVRPVIDLLQTVCGSLDTPGTGIAFTVPLDEVFGLAPALRESQAHERAD